MKRNESFPGLASTRTVLLAYYGATVLFLLLDYVFDLNLRIAFLENYPAARLGYYLFCFACFALMLWRPALTAIVASFESLMTLAGLIIGFGARAMLLTMPDAGLEPPMLGLAGIVNFLLSGSIAYYAWWRGMREWQGSTRSR